MHVGKQKLSKASSALAWMCTGSCMLGFGIVEEV